MSESSARPELATVRVMSRCSRIETRILQQIAHADDGVQRRAQFVAHDRQEAALGLVGLLGLGLGLGQLADEGGDIGWQHDQAGDEAEGQVRLGLPVFGEDDGQEADDAGQRRGGEVADAVAETVAEGDPEIDRIERRAGFPAPIHER